MPYKLEFTHPHFPKDYEFGISMLGRVKNGGSLDVDEDMERSLVANTGKPLNELFKDNPHVDLSGNSSLSPEELKSLTPEPEPTEALTSTNTEQNANANANANTGTGTSEGNEEGEE